METETQVIKFMIDICMALDVNKVLQLLDVGNRSEKESETYVLFVCSLTLGF